MLNSYYNMIITNNQRNVKNLWTDQAIGFGCCKLDLKRACK